MNPTAFELIIAAVVVIGIAWLVLKEYYPQAVLTVAGIILYLAAHWISGVPIIEKSTGFALLDVFVKLKNIFSYRMGGLGLIIMAVAGFGAYMSHIGASQALVRVSTKPVAFINNSWVVLGLAYLIGIFVSLFITSATGLGLMLMVTLYPIMLGAGISKASAVGVIATSQAFELGHVQSNVVRASEAIGMTPVNYFVDYQLLIGAILVIVTMFVHIYWQRRCDIKDGWDPKEHVGLEEEVSDEKANKIMEKTAPGYYAILPLVPFVMLLLFSKLVFGNPDFLAWMKSTIGIDYTGPAKMNLTVAMLVSVFLAMVIHGLRERNLKKTATGYKVFLDGMASVFASVVVLIVAAQIFATALKDMGAVNALLNFASGLGIGGMGMIVVSTAFIAMAAFIMGSGVASFMSFVEIAPDIASKFAISKISVMLPMQMGSSIGRSMSPIAAVIVAIAGIAGLKTTEVVRRTVVPMMVSIVLCIGLTMLFYG